MTQTNLICEQKKAHCKYFFSRATKIIKFSDQVLVNDAYGTHLLKDLSSPR